jgi:hypothetical protein
MAAAIGIITIGALLVYESLHGVGLTDVLAGNAGSPLNPAGGRGFGGGIGGVAQAAADSIANLTGSGGYVSPFEKGTYTVGRTDQGVDVSLHPGDPIHAIGDARIIGIQQNWYQGQPFLWYQLLSGPRKGSYIYVAEQFNPSVHPGQVVRKGQVIGHYASSGTAIETGFATRSGGVLTPYNSSDYESATPGGNAFRKFLDALLGN